MLPFGFGKVHKKFLERAWFSTKLKVLCIYNDSSLLFAGRLLSAILY
jgi:hypothetical protein